MGVHNSPGRRVVVTLVEVKKNGQGTGSCSRKKEERNSDKGDPGERGKHSLFCYSQGGGLRGRGVSLERGLSEVLQKEAGLRVFKGVSHG